MKKKPVHLPQLPDALNALNRARFEAAYLPKPVLPEAEQKPPTQEKGQRKGLHPARQQIGMPSGIREPNI